MFKTHIEKLLKNITDAVFVIYDAKKSGTDIPEFVDVDGYFQLSLKGNRICLASVDKKVKRYAKWNYFSRLVQIYLNEYGL